MMLAGEGIPRDTERGRHWTRLSADQGFAPAEYTMGVACQYGDEPGGAEAAATWFGRAAEAGISAAQYELGVAYINGDGVAPGQEARGARWLHEAAAAGHKDAIADLAQLALDPAWEHVERQMSLLQGNAAGLNKDEV
jgi:TPR repeat protein